MMNPKAPWNAAFWRRYVHAGNAWHGREVELLEVGARAVLKWVAAAMTGDRPDYAARSRTRRRRAPGPGRIGSAFHETVATNVMRIGIDRMLWVDPGFVNCGMAEFEQGEEEGRWRCTQAWRMAPLEAIGYVEDWLANSGEGDLLGIEAFRLYPWLMEQQGFSELGTPEIIGVLRWLHRSWGVERGCLLVLQGADKKRMGQTRMRQEQISFVATNQHGRDAESHGWAFILQAEKEAARQKRKAP